jgi:hypothetical protein
MDDGFMGGTGSHKPNLTPLCVSDIQHTMHAYNGWACSMKVHASKWEALDDPVVTEVFYLKFEPAKKDRIVR